MKRNFSVLASFAGLALSVACGSSKNSASDPDAVQADIEPGTEVQATVQACHDGDTCVMRLVGGNHGSFKVRFIGIDAPEVSGGDGNHGQPLGTDAKAKLNGLIKGKDVRVRALKLDPYERMLGEVFLGDTNVNQEMLKSGMAEAYLFGDAAISASAYKQAQKVAKDADLGIWSLANYERPEDFRQRTNPH